MTTKSVSIRLALDGKAEVKAGLKEVGEAGQKAGEDTAKRLEAVAEIPKDGGADARTGEHERGQHVDAQQRRHEPVTNPPVGLPRGYDDQREPGDQRDRGGRAGDGIGLLIVRHWAPLWRTRPANNAKRPTRDQIATASAIPPKTSVK